MYHEFSVAETVKTSWDILRKNFVTIMVYWVISVIIMFVLGFSITIVVSPDQFVLTMAITFVFLIILAFSNLGLYKLIFTLIDNEYYEFEFSQTLPTVRKIISYLVVIFLIAFLVTNFNIIVEKIPEHSLANDIVTLLGRIIAAYLVLKIMFFITFIVDDDSGPIESIKQSFKLSRGYFFKAFIMLIIIWLLIYLPLILATYYPLISLAVVLTFPFVNIILAVTYRKLVYSHQDVDDDPLETI